MPEGKLKAGFDEALAELGNRGLLLVHDNAFPSLTRLTIGEPIRGSWWAHPLSNDVYMVSQQLQHCGDVVMTKLVSGKETYVHSRLWPHLLAIGIAREGWQLDGLAAPAHQMLADVDREGMLRMDQYRSTRSRKELGEDARTIALRLLAYADDVHTESGAHARRLTSWRSWAEDRHIAMDSLPSASDARREVEQIVETANAEGSAGALLPWQNKRRKKSSPL
jgi:hypothetical protein